MSVVEAACRRGEERSIEDVEGRKGWMDGMGWDGMGCRGMAEVKWCVAWAGAGFVSGTISPWPALILAAVRARDRRPAQHGALDVTAQVG